MPRKSSLGSGRPCEYPEYMVCVCVFFLCVFFLFSVSNSCRNSKVKRSLQALTLENTEDTQRIENEMQNLEKEMGVSDAKRAK